MSDLVERLRDRAGAYSTQELTYQLLVEAAARIEALEAGLKPFAEAHNAVSRSIANGRYGNTMSAYVHDEDWKLATSLLETKP